MCLSLFSISPSQSRLFIEACCIDIYTSAINRLTLKASLLVQYVCCTSLLKREHVFAFWEREINRIWISDFLATARVASCWQIWGEMSRWSPADIIHDLRNRHCFSDLQFILLLFFLFFFWLVAFCSTKASILLWSIRLYYIIVFWLQLIWSYQQFKCICQVC